LHYSNTSRYIAIAHNVENGTYTEYPYELNNFLADRFYRKLISESEWFEKVIKHPGYIGTFYENLLRNTIREFAPSNNCVSTGFVYDAENNIHSKQIDILIYDDTDRNILYRNSEFSVVYPGSVISVTEVKKTIKVRNLKETIESTFFNSLGSKTDSIYGMQNLRIFGFNLGCSIETLFSTICETIESCIKSTIESGTSAMLENITLPSVYFLRENYLVETRLMHHEDMSYKVKIELHETENASSLGSYLSVCTRENSQKKSRYESNYMFKNMRPLAIKSYVTKSSIILFKKYSFTEVLSYYEIEASLYKSIINKKPIRIYLPITKSLSDYHTFEDLLRSSENKAVLLGGNRDNCIIDSSQLLS
jgi:hypothetical protein